jgi:hypothetical protein
MCQPSPWGGSNGGMQPVQFPQLPPRNLSTMGEGQQLPFIYEGEHTDPNFIVNLLRTLRGPQ